MAEFTYQCPHCREATTVGLESLGRPALCHSCAKPYLAEVPAGRLMVDGGESGMVAAGDPNNRAAEQDVLTINPAAFRERPVQTMILAGLILAGLTGLIMFGGEASQGFAFAALVAFSAFVTVAATVVLAWRFAVSKFELLTVTTQRSVWARGIINRRSSEVQHDDIRNIQVHQDLVQRLVGAGTIAISSAGQDDMEIVAQGIANPHHVIETIRTHQRRMVTED